MAHDIDRFAAFKAWRTEQKVGTRTVPAFGSEWEFPARMPAALWLYIQERKAEGRPTNVMTDDDMWELVHIAVPDEVLAEWRKLPITIDEMAEATMNVVRSYHSDADPEAPTPEAGTTTSSSPSTSSPTGDSSRPTSSGSTDSTSAPPSETA